MLLFIPAHPPSAPIRKDRANLTEASRGGFVGKRRLDEDVHTVSCACFLACAKCR